MYVRSVSSYLTIQ